MRRVRIGVSAVLMILAMLLCGRAEIFLLYTLSAGLHELGHIFAARLLKIGIKEIKFDYSGVRICTEDAVTSYKSEFLLAAAGPLVNFLLIFAVVTFMKIKGISLNEAAGVCGELLLEGRYSHLGAIGFVALSSLLQGCVNLLPVKTFDGGRMAYCMSAQLFGERSAERILDVFSAFSAFMLWTVALYLMLRISSGLGIYVFSATLFFSTVKANKKEA